MVNKFVCEKKATKILQKITGQVRFGCYLFRCLFVCLLVYGWEPWQLCTYQPQNFVGEFDCVWLVYCYFGFAVYSGWVSRLGGQHACIVQSCKKNLWEFNILFVSLLGKEKIHWVSKLEFLFVCWFDWLLVFFQFTSNKMLHNCAISILSYVMTVPLFYVYEISLFKWLVDHRFRFGKLKIKVQISKNKKVYTVKQ